MLLNAPPFVGFPQLIPLSAREFVVLIAGEASRAIIVYKYSTHKNTWTSSFESNIFDPMRIQNCACMALANGLLHIISDSGLFAIDNKRKNAKMCMRSNGAELLLIEDKVHMIGGYESADHKVINMHKQTTKQSEKVVHRFDDGGRNALAGHTAMYLKTKQCILLFGAGDGSKIYQFCVKGGRENKWTELQRNLDSHQLHLKDSQIVIDREERFAFILGGIEEDDALDEMTDNISVYNIKHNIFRRSTVKMPSTSWSSAICVNNERYVHLLSFGYCKCTETQVMPYCLVQLIANFMSNEEIHVIYHGKHYKIQTDKILNNLL